LQNAYGIKNAQDFLVQQPPQQGPFDKLIETVNYKDTPPDIQRQIEAQAGLQPSQMGPEMGLAPNPNPPQGSKSGSGGGNNGGGSPAKPDATMGTSLPTPGPMAIPPRLLTQLQNQEGLSLPNSNQQKAPHR
jgi:hypothetical protein